MILRDYQAQALAAMKASSGGLVIIPTGGGKTNVFLSYLKGVRGRALVLAHRKELIEQVRNRFDDLDVGTANEPERRIVAGTTQGMVNGIERYLSYGAPEVVILDEAHRAMTADFLYVWRMIRELSPWTRLFGFTATPERTDKLPLSFVFGERPVFSISLRKLVEMGWLCPISQVDINLNARLRGRGDDFTATQIETALSPLDRVVVEQTRLLNEGRPTILYTGTVAQSQRMAEYARHLGLRAEAVHYKTANSAEVARRLQDGKLDLVINPLLWVEGIDIPAVSCIAWARPTKSRLTFAQAIGRAMRPHPSKKDAIILSFNPIADGLAKLEDVIEERKEVMNPGLVRAEVIRFVSSHAGVR